MKKFLFVAFVVFAMCGCGDSSNDIDKGDNTRHDEENLDTGMFPASHFITDYCVPSEIKVNNISGTLNLVVKGEVYGSSREKGKEFAEFYGDTSYGGYTFPGMTSSLAYPIDKITISCAVDFDAEHPAGEPLDDIVKLEFETLYEFVENGYKLPAGISRENTKNGWEVIHLLCFEDVNADVATLVYLNPFVAQLINVTPLIHFASQPEKAGEYTFTIEMTTNGETFETTFTHTFE